MAGAFRTFAAFCAAGLTSTAVAALAGAVGAFLALTLTGHAEGFLADLGGGYKDAGQAILFVISVATAAGAFVSIISIVVVGLPIYLIVLRSVQAIYSWHCTSGGAIVAVLASLVVVSWQEVAAPLPADLYLFEGFSMLIAGVSGGAVFWLIRFGHRLA